MEDEDGESKVVDMWSILGEQQLKDTTLGNSLKTSIDTAYADEIEEEKQILRYNSITTKDSPSKNTNTGSKIVFKGFKKRILAQAQETQTITSRSFPQEQQLSHANVSPKTSKEKRTEAKRGKITEYAQYLGLQPSSKYKCSKCHTSTNFCSTLKQNSCTCNPTMTPMPSTSESSTVPHSTNFKITRKVYLCAACGTYFENWNLFLHMRDIHKRHICLFCLGMFGQAERLSYHLTKKHSVPEMAFTSVEDFYGAFKGSCYLVCCTCEKVFSETDNFYNHFCSPPSKQDVTASICTLCRQTGSHASTCSLAIETSKEINSTVPVATQAGTIPTHILERPITSGNKTASKKAIKNNRSKHVEDGIPNSFQQKANTHIKKSNKVITPQGTESQSSNDALSQDGSSQSEITHNSVRDTVSETIMEVSRYPGESYEECDENSDKNVCQEEVSEVKSPTIHNDSYDTVTETIMEVSRANNAHHLDNTLKKEDSSSTDGLDTSDRQDSISDDACNMEALNSSRDDDARLEEPSIIHEETKESKADNETAGAASEVKIDPSSQGCESPPQSPLNRSLFSPQHDSLVSDLQTKEESDENESKEEKEEIIEAPTESQTSVSFNAVPSSDRSLVIKICTNRNSQFSVATPANTENLENHDVSRESEENNNADESVMEEKTSNVSERERDSNSSYQVNEGDSDSDSDKLAVVDSNPEEAEDADEADEPEEAEEIDEPEEAEEAEEVEEVDDVEGTDEIENASDIRTEINVEANEEESHVQENKEEQVTNVDANESHDDNEEVNSIVNDETNNTGQTLAPPSDGIILAGEDVPCIDLNVEGTLDSMDIEDILKRCIEAASPICVYCNHARHIAVNGKQLGLHMLAEHKFQPQHPAIIIQAEQYIIRVKKSLDELESRQFNLNSYSSTNGTYNVPDVRTYECFHCRFHSAVHKELYLHNRKMHQKTILICIMCKSTFYSYSELLCHLCPGTYSPNINVKYRCCLCPVTNLPSAFRLMVHLRKRHHACDVCLESTGNQQRLSNHVWKHKLHHLCYRCGIAYRNKPDITKHLFWKHGTESVLCKKCLQKKWPHIYHFCIPPTAFVCEECGSSFSRAVALKVHKRLHSGDRPYACNECTERFISKKLLDKHQNTHKEQPPIEVTMTDTVSHQPVADEEKSDKDVVLDSITTASEPVKDSKETVKKVVDVYDLPPLNLSSESDTDSEDEKVETKEPENIEKAKPVEETTTSPADLQEVVTSEPTKDNVVEVEQDEEEQEQGAQIMDGIWDNFKSYTASLGMKDSSANFAIKEPELETDVAFLRSIVLADHDYCVVWSDKDKEAEGGSKDVEKAEASFSGDQENTNKTQKSPIGNNGLQSTNENDPSKKKVKTPKKKKSGSTSSSDSSSDSDSSSCSCGTNCSCSSSSSGSSSSSSSSSDSDSSASESSPRKQSNRKDRKKDKETTQEPEATTVEPENKEISIDVENGGTTVPNEPVCPPLLLRESDLETDETETDEDFYDEHPQQLANKLLAEKRNQLLLLAAVAPASTDSSIPLNNGITDTDSVIPSPDPMSASVEDQPQQKKKVKTKKRKKGEKAKQRNATPTVESIKLNIPKAFYQKNLGFSGSLPTVMTLHPSRSSTPNLSTNDVHGMNAGVESQSMGTANQSIGGSGSETENKRSSKRKRVPKRFYGDSSDEEVDKQPAMKWRKAETPSFIPTPPIKVIPPRVSFGGKALPYRPVENPTENLTIAAASATESEEPAESSSDSSDSEVEASQPAQTHLTETNTPIPERPVNLYCYCQCPYDEVSEMIACDGEDCRIEWFHFECVGIMVPPKGKWYCPDCRKKHGIVENNEEYFD